MRLVQIRVIKTPVYPVLDKMEFPEELTVYDWHRPLVRELWQYLGEGVGDDLREKDYSREGEE